MKYSTSCLLLLVAESARAKNAVTLLRLEALAAKYFQESPRDYENDTMKIDIHTTEDGGDNCLWNGCLCSVGVDFSCSSLLRSQSDDGRVWRSPAQVNANFGDNSFSRDMFLGVRTASAANDTIAQAMLPQYSEYIITTGRLCAPSNFSYNANCGLRWGDICQYDTIAMQSNATIELLQPGLAQYFPNLNISISAFCNHEYLDAETRIEVIANAVQGSGSPLYLDAISLLTYRFFLNVWTTELQEAADALAASQKDNLLYDTIALGTYSEAIALKWLDDLAPPAPASTCPSEWCWNHIPATECFDLGTCGWDALFFTKLLIYLASNN